MGKYFNLSASLAVDLFFKQINTLLDEHAPINKSSKKDLSLTMKPWISKSIQPLMRERNRLFKFYCQEANPTVFKIKESKKQYYQNFQRTWQNLKKTWYGIKLVVTLKSKAKTSPNFFFVKRNIIANKTFITETFNIFL